MTTERIVGPLQKVMQSIADLATPRDPLSAASDTGTPAKSHEAAKLPPPAQPLLPSPDPGLIVPPAGDDALRGAAFGLPPPAVALNTGHAATLPLATALQAVGDRFLSSPLDAPRRKDDANDDRTQMSSVINVQATGEVRETQFVKGVPKASTTIATDDRPRVRVPEERPEGASHRPAARQPEAEATRFDPLQTPTPSDRMGRLGRDSTAIEALAVALATPASADTFAGRILPSAILNAAMLPGWPPPRALEGKAITGTSEHALAALRREDQIAAILAALGTDLETLLGGPSDRKMHWRALRRVIQILSAFMLLVSTIGAELAEMQGEEQELAEGRGSSGTHHGTSRRIYLD